MSLSRPVLKPSPLHSITIEPTPGRVVVSVGGRVVADTRRALTLDEARHAPVQYVPLEDVDRSLLAPSARTTYCPYKGDASYFDVTLPDGGSEAAMVWTYAEPYEAVSAIAGHVAFYADRADVRVLAD
jgi:uncharacterized protein (DUF427 family)